MKLAEKWLRFLILHIRQCSRTLIYLSGPFPLLETEIFVIVKLRPCRIPCIYITCTEMSPKVIAITCSADITVSWNTYLSLCPLPPFRTEIIVAVKLGPHQMLLACVNCVANEASSKVTSVPYCAPMTVFWNTNFSLLAPSSFQGSDLCSREVGFTRKAVSLY